MVNKLKHFIHRLLPSSKSQINDRFDKLNQEISCLNTKLNYLIELEKEISSLENNIIDLQKYIDNLDKKIDYSNSVTVDTIENNTDLLKNNVQIIQKEIGELGKKANVIKRQTDESVWADTWHDAIKESTWLKHQMFTPGRWAIGYQYLYVLYRVLNEFKPNSILELGLGQSTKMISQYVQYNKDACHIVVEHDTDWEQFYRNNNQICERTIIKHLDLDKEQFNDDKEVLVYKEFGNAFPDKNFDFISIDAPFGGKAIKYARIDILKIIPQCLENRFVIMLDDYNRSGERETIKELRKKLDENRIEYCCGTYCGAKDCFVITSKNYKFLCSM